MTAAHAGARVHCIFFLALRACLGLHAVGRVWGTASDIDLRIINRTMPANIPSEIEHAAVMFIWC
jgi:hypothetical protein